MYERKKKTPLEYHPRRPSIWTKSISKREKMTNKIIQANFLKLKNMSFQICKCQEGCKQTFNGHKKYLPEVKDLGC